MSISGWGGGQRIRVVAELDLTIVITGHNREGTIMTQISNVVVPASVFSPITSIAGELTEVFRDIS
ncbi:MAG: hypothetical protein JKY60_19670 [Kordiimonadaceae bacterium]|nr:hypothetical protein [Kordiimonadaceae bacterium]